MSLNRVSHIVPVVPRVKGIVMFRIIIWRPTSSVHENIVDQKDMACVNMLTSCTELYCN